MAQSVKESWGYCYRHSGVTNSAPFVSDRDRLEHLFGRFEALVNPLEREAIKQNQRINSKAAKEGARR